MSVPSSPLKYSMRVSREGLLESLQHFLMSLEYSEGVWGGMGGLLPCRTSWMISMKLWPAKGVVLVNSSHNTIPREYTSTNSSYSCPLKISGAGVLGEGISLGEKIESFSNFPGRHTCVARSTTIIQCCALLFKLGETKVP